MNEPIWIVSSVANSIHNAVIAKYGGGTSGIRDEGLLESALARPINSHAYGQTDLCALAASYAYGIARNHPYIDGNKRTAFVTACLFLQTNGLEVTMDEAIATTAMLDLAAGKISEEEFATWLHAHTKK